MADGDTPVAGTLGPINPASPLAFMLGGGDLGSLSLEEIKRRRAIALALASRSKGYPKTFGEGLTYLGESIGDRLAEERLAAAEKTFEKRYVADPLARPLGAGAPAAAATPAVATPPVAAAPAGVEGQFGGRPFTPVTVAPTERRLPAGIMDPASITGDAGDAVSPDERKNRLAALLMPEGVGQANPTVGAPSQAPRGPQLATLNPLGTMSDAPPIGAPRPMPDVENPPTPTDIQLMPRLAQAGAGTAALPGGAAMGPNPVPMPAVPGAVAGAPGALAPIPGVFDPLPTAAKVPSIDFKPIDPAARGPLTKPVAPLKQETPTEEELRGMALKQKYPGYERAQQQGDALISFGKEKREAAYARKVKEYDADMAVWQQGELAERAYARDLPQKQAESAEKQRGIARTIALEQDFPLTVGEHVKLAQKSFEKVDRLAEANTAIKDIRTLINSDKSMFTGADAGLNLGLAKMWTGYFGGPPNPKASNTEIFKGLIPPILAALRPTIVGTGQQALPELQMLQDAAAGKITLERDSILGILGAIEKNNQKRAVDHQQTMLANFPTSDYPETQRIQQRMFATMGLPMEKFVPPDKVQKLMDLVERNKDDVNKVKGLMQEFDKDYFTPGLSSKLLLGR